MAYTNSSMVAYTKLSPNHSGQMTMAIDRITPHCVVGQCTAEGLGDWFAKNSTQASSNYGIDKDGRVGMYVEEKNRSWCSSSNANDQRAITIECASDTTEPYAFRDVVYKKLIELCIDICKRNRKNKLIWFGDKDKTLNYSPKSGEMILTVHRWFANKSCPGNWMYARMGDLAEKVTKALQGSSDSGGGSAAKGTQASVLKNLAEADAIKKVGALFTADQKKSGILASVSLAQFILESGYGKSELAQNANNIFGMKCIISKDLFEVVQQLLKTDCRSASGKNTSHLYSGLLFCGDCGEQMTRRVNRYKGQEKVYFICSNYNKNKKCSRHSILQDDLDKLVLYGIKSRVELILDQMTVIAKVKDLDMRYDDIVAFDKEIVDLKAEQEKYKKLRAALYEDYKRGIIGEEDFKTFSAIYEEKYAAIESDLEKQMQNLKELFKNGLEAGMKLEQYKDVLQVESLNRTTLVHLVEKIYVYDDKRVHVVLRHQNQFIKVAMLRDFLKHSEAERQVK